MTADDAVDHHTGDTGLRVRYGAWRRWVRAMRARGGRRRASADGGDPHDRAYLVYGLTLVVLMYTPILWVALAEIVAPLGTGSSVRDALVAVGVVALGFACLGGVLLHRFGAPLWVSQTDATYALAGVWDPRAVLWRRVVVLVVVTAVLAGLIGSAVASGVIAAAADDGGPTGLGPVLAWGACAAGVTLLPLALAVAAQCPRRRVTARVAAVVVAVVGALVARQGAGLLGGCPVPVAGLGVDPGPLPDVPATSTCGALEALGPPAEVVGWAVALAVVSVWLLIAVLPRHLDVDAAADGWHRVAVTGAGLQGGDASGLGRVAVPSWVGGRAVRLPVGLAARSAVVARDVLGLRRRPVAVLGSVAAGGLGVLLVAAGLERGALAVVLGAVVLYAASATWTGGLRAMAGQSVPGGLLPGALGRQVATHLLVPTGLALVAGACGLGFSALVGVGSGHATAAAVAAVLVGVLGARAWVAGASTVPVALFTPVPGPTGDLAMVSVAAWYLRGWLVVATLAWAADRWGAVVAVAAAGLAWLLVRSAVQRLERE